MPPRLVPSRSPSMPQNGNMWCLRILDHLISPKDSTTAARLSLTRRRLALGGLALATLAGHGRAQPEAPEVTADGFRILRIRALAPGGPAPEVGGSSPGSWSYGSVPGPALRV